MAPTVWHTQDSAAVLADLATDESHGLSAAEAARRREQYGPNALQEKEGASPWRILLAQFTSLMVIVLIVAAVASLALGDVQDAVVILAIVILNAVLGFRQEYSAEQALAALKRLAVPAVRVRRDGHVQVLSAEDLVPGDVVLLEAGNRVPADGRVVESANLRVQEAALTGESEPIDKHTGPLADPELSLGDRRNMVFMGTVVVHGRGLAVVTETGQRTTLGGIADLLQGVKAEPTPLQQRLDQLARWLVGAALAIVALVFVLGLLRGEDVRLLFLTAISLAVAAVPEGLPAVVTIGLALGAQRMLKRQALIRRLPAVETLGSVTVICSDKTGTLTENRMTVTVLDVAGNREDLSETLQVAGPGLREAATPLSGLSRNSELALLATGGALCNDAILEPEGDGSDRWEVVGDPTEGALLVTAARMGLWKQDLDRVFPRVAEAPFDAGRKRMTTVHRLPENPSSLPPALADSGAAAGLADARLVGFTKGAVGSLLDVTAAVLVDDEVRPLNDEYRDRILTANDELAAGGMRVLGVAYRPLDTLPTAPGPATLERDLVFVGLTGMLDPPRPEVRGAIRTCQSAGIRVVMITGDHPLTARSIASDLGIAADRVMTGPELERLDEGALESVVMETSVYARVSPEHKLRIVRALQAKGELAAMTGDGVNDAPALKQADIGVAMGITGTDVAKEAADMVLQDDNFATIVAAVEEGRVIYENTRKFIRYILGSNFAELLTMLAAPFLGMPLPLLPLQILWINLITDGAPALALSVAPADRDVMARPPHPPSESVFSRGLGRGVVAGGVIMGVLALGAGWWYWANGLETWQTMVFTTLTFAQMGNVLAVGAGLDLFTRAGPGRHRVLLGSVALTVLLQLAVIYVPWLQGLFNTSSLAPVDLAVSVLLSAVVYLVVLVEIRHWRRRDG